MSPNFRVVSSEGASASAEVAGGLFGALARTVGGLPRSPGAHRVVGGLRGGPRRTPSAASSGAPAHIVLSAVPEGDPGAHRRWTPREPRQLHACAGATSPRSLLQRGLWCVPYWGHWVSGCNRIRWGRRSLRLPLGRVGAGSVPYWDPRCSGSDGRGGTTSVEHRECSRRARHLRSSTARQPACPAGARLLLRSSGRRRQRAHAAATTAISYYLRVS